jgi:hypothetical protein
MRVPALHLNSTLCARRPSVSLPSRACRTEATGSSSSSTQQRRRRRRAAQQAESEQRRHTAAEHRDAGSTRRNRDTGRFQETVRTGLTKRRVSVDRRWVAPAPLPLSLPQQRQTGNHRQSVVMFTRLRRATGATAAATALPSNGDASVRPPEQSPLSAGATAELFNSVRQ